MNQNISKLLLPPALFLVAAFSASAQHLEQNPTVPKNQQSDNRVPATSDQPGMNSPDGSLPNRTDPTAGTAAAANAYGFSAKLADMEENARRNAARVEVRSSGLTMIDPATVDEKPRRNQGHIHYQLDDGPIVATTEKKLSFTNLTPGEHKITVSLVGNDSTPIGPQETLLFTIPAAQYQQGM